jgi:hypothetical protein
LTPLGRDHPLPDADDRRRYEDSNDAEALRDPMFKLALDRLPSDEDLCSQSTISRLENLPDRRALLRLAGALVEQYCASFRQVPQRIVLDIDDTFDREHGAQLLRCSMPSTTTTGFSRSSCSTAKAASRRPCCGRASGRAPDPRLAAAAGRGTARAGRGSRPWCAPTATTPPRKCSIGAGPTAWLMLTLRGLAPRTSFWRDAQFDTIRLCLIKVAGRDRNGNPDQDRLADHLPLPDRVRHTRRPNRQAAALSNGAACPRTSPSAQPQTPIRRVIDATKNHVQRPTLGRKPVPLMNDLG